MSQSLQLAAPPDADDGYLVDNDALIRLGGSVEQGRAKLRMMLADERDTRPKSGPTEKPASVRLATVRDEPAILDLLLADLEENAKNVAPVSIKRVMENVTLGTRGQGGFVPVVDGPDGEPWAVAVLAPIKWWWSDTVFLSETSMYVAPIARKTHAGADLLQFECWLSEQMDMFVLAGVTATKRARAKLRLYGRFMNPCGGFMIFPAVEGLTL